MLQAEQNKQVRAYRHGDVTIKYGATIPHAAKKLAHCVLAEGEVTGHKHQITEGDATLYEHQGTLYLRVKSETATLTHEEHQPIVLPQGEFEIAIQREYRPGGWDAVSD